MYRLFLILTLFFSLTFSKSGFVDTITKKDKYFIIHNGINESKREGTYSIKVYKSSILKEFLYGTIQKREGEVIRFFIKDVDFDNKPELIIERKFSNGNDFDILTVEKLEQKKVSKDKTYKGILSFGATIDDFECHLNSKFTVTADKKVLEYLKKEYDKITTMPYQEVYIVVKANATSKLKISALFEMVVK